MIDIAQDEKINREDKIPITNPKITVETDIYPPIMHSDEYYEPKPLIGDINTAGAEDSPFINPEGDQLFFFFTPDVSISPDKQLLDGVTGLYFSRLINGMWSKSQRLLSQNDELALDGCPFIQDDNIMFCSIREGYNSIKWFRSSLSDQEVVDVELVPFRSDMEVGELHISVDNSKLFYHSLRLGGQGGLDIWVSERLGNIWSDPVNIESINTSADEGWPFITNNGQELWFSRTYQGSPAIFRSRFVSNKWQTPELIISQFAGEPSLDNEGNIYFVHHYYKEGIMLEADIYVAIKK